MRLERYTPEQIEKVRQHYFAMPHPRHMATLRDATEKLVGRTVNPQTLTAWMKRGGWIKEAMMHDRGDVVAPMDNAVTLPKGAIDTHAELMTVAHYGIYALKRYFAEPSRSIHINEPAHAKQIAEMVRGCIECALEFAHSVANKQAKESLTDMVDVSIRAQKSARANLETYSRLSKRFDLPAVTKAMTTTDVV